VEISRAQINRFSFSTTIRQYFRKVPCSAGYDKDMDAAGFPAITAIMIAVDTILFFSMPEDRFDRLCSLPLDDFGLAHLMLTTVASAFLHPDFRHLFINMLFLWVFGALLEPRMAPGQYLAAILLGSVLSSLISLNLMVSQVNLLDAPLKLLRYPPAGASGAVSGLMGLSALRYGAAWRSVRGPIRCHPRFSFAVPITTTVLIGLFFVRDLAGHTAPAVHMAGTANFWGHVGGFLGGLVLALVRTLRDSDPDEGRADAGGRRGSEWVEAAGDRHPLEMLIPVAENTPTRGDFLPIKAPSRERQRKASTTG
jgi:membrane associated rhomboid family serine protease